MVDLAGRIVDCNQKFVTMWAIPDETMQAHDDARVLDLVLGQLARPQQFLEAQRLLSTLPEEESFDELELLDGRIVSAIRYHSASTEGALGGSGTFAT